MKISIENKNYILDVDAARANGILVEIRELRLGDVFKNTCCTLVVMKSRHNDENSYYFAGLNGLNPWNTELIKHGSLLELSKYLNYHLWDKPKYCGNISEEFAELLRKK
jgi:hypothetical protein